MAGTVARIIKFQPENGISVGRMHAKNRAWHLMWLCCGFLVADGFVIRLISSMPIMDVEGAEH
jgi:hypothetical protein